jgi:preprotein translocase subunit SecY
MASAAERLASNINFGSFSKATELKKRIWFTLLALVIYRLGTFIPIPGIDASVLSEVFSKHKGGMLGIFDVFSGGALGRMTIFALNVFPYISASIIMQLMTTVSPKLEALKKEGEAGRKKINQYTRYGTVFLAALQGYGIAVGLESMVGSSGSAVLEPGYFFRLIAVTTIVGGTMFLVWLGEQITSRGIGNGVSLIIFSGIVANIPSGLATLFELGRTGELSTIAIIAIMILALGVIAFVVFMERAQRRILIQYPQRQAGPRSALQAESTHLPLKLNVSGVIPPIFASALLSVPMTIMAFSGDQAAPGPIKSFFLNWLGSGKPLNIVIFALLIIFFAFFYTAIVFNPQETSENLRKNGGFVPGIRPGKNTADYLDYVLTRLTVIGSAYLVLVCTLPELLRLKYTIPFTIGGTSLLIVVSVTIDTITQIYSHLIAQQYESLIKKAKLKGR